MTGRRLPANPRQGERGVVLVAVALSAAAMLGFAAFVVDLGFAMYAHRQLQASADAAASAGAIDIGVAGQSAVQTATAYSGIPGSKNARPNLPNVSMSTGYPLLTCLTSTGMPACSGTPSVNAIVVKQQMNAPLFFARVLGISSLALSASATAVHRGGMPQPLDVMLVLDTTASMNTSDTSCSVSGATRLTCALAGVQALLKGLWPCAQNLATCGAAVNGNVASPVDRVGLMVFPGLTDAAQPQYEYDCNSTPHPTIARYSASPVYQVIPLSSDYRASATAATLQTSSNLVKAAHAGATGCQQGLEAPGGVGTFFADAITAAQSVLTTTGRSGVQKVIVVLSDGDAGASSSNISAAKYANQCQQAVNAAHTATTAGTWVYAVAYGASTSSTGSCSTDSPHISACTAMQQIASDATRFFSDTVGGSTCTSSAHSITELVQIFSSVGMDLTTSRLVPDNTP